MVNLNNTLFARSLQARQEALDRKRMEDQAAMQNLLQQQKYLEAMRDKDHARRMEAAKVEGSIAAETGRKVPGYKNQQLAEAASRAQRAHQAQAQRARTEQLNKAAYQQLLEQTKQRAATGRTLLTQRGAMERARMQEKGQAGRAKAALEQRRAEAETSKADKDQRRMIMFERLAMQQQENLSKRGEKRSDKFLKSAKTLIDNGNEMMLTGAGDESTARRMIQEGLGHLKLYMSGLNPNEQQRASDYMAGLDPGDDAYSPGILGSGWGEEGAKYLGKVPPRGVPEIFGASAEGIPDEAEETDVEAAIRARMRGVD